ncbi:hypothetical protein Pfo_027992 [Paulownia fortunei]|nr:hypothetical protein Pfo_027992 [Paulownia fortunei]
MAEEGRGDVATVKSYWYTQSNHAVEYLFLKRPSLPLVYFGQNLVCTDSLSEGRGKSIKVGDSVFVLKMVSSAADAAA